MITGTTETGIQALLYLVLKRSRTPISPRQIAEDLGLSPTYLAKTTAALVKADILAAHRGVKGGVVLRRAPDAITLLEIVEALQGKVVGRYCETGSRSIEGACSFHQAMLEVHTVTLGVLTKWSLADLAEQPVSEHENTDAPCLMACLRGGCPSGPAV